MAAFVDSEAEIGTTDEESEDSLGSQGGMSKINKRKSKKKRRRQAVMDSDDEDEGKFNI